MKKSLEKYTKFVNEKNIVQLCNLARKLEGRHILHINSTYQGGGVAEILNRIIPLMNELGIITGWRILHGNPNFFITTKKFYNALQGEKINLTEQKQKLYLKTNERFSLFTHIQHDCVIIHDTQPLPLIRFYKKKQPWIWRCHTDLSTPEKNMLRFLSKFINSYTLAIMLSKRFIRKELKINQIAFPPSIDPLSTKNQYLKESFIDRYLKKFDIPLDKPILCQVSRFDKWKDHLGVIKIFREVRKKVPSRLVLIGSSALDDPMGQEIYESILRKVSGDKDIILVNKADDLLVNALQRKASVVYQKSFKEGFGLTVAEAMWKSTPVIASKVGGIQDQILHGKNGFLIDVYDNKGFINTTLKLLKDKKLRKKISINAKETIREKFLIITHLTNWLATLIKIFEKK